MSWLHYLIEANIYLGVFYLCYCLFLIRDTHYTLSRVYLIFSCVVAFVLPVTQLSILKPAEIIAPLIEEPTFTGSVIHPVINAPTAAAPASKITFDDVVINLYVAGVALALLVLIFRLRKLYILTRKNQALDTNQYKLVKLKDKNTAFSFFNYLFIGSNVPQPETVIAHELVHIRQKHSADIIFLEIVKIFNWFNPFIYLIQRSLKTIHEYIADEQTAAHEQDTLAYSSFLLNNAYGIQGNSIAHSFFNYNLLKKRIIMLNKNRSGKLARLKYLAAVPLCAGMLCASTLVFSKDYGFIELAPRKAKAIKPAIDSAKYTLKVTEKRSGITVISDKMVHTDEKTGEKTTYTPANLTPEKQAEALKNGGFIIERIVRTDSATHTLQLTAPDGTKGTSDIVMVEDAKTNFKHTYTVNTLSDNDKKELKARGYNLAIIERPKELADTGKRPPPPPAPPKQNRMPPPPAPPKVKDQVKLPLPARPNVKDQIKLPPPPPPIENKKLKGVKSPPAVSIVIDTPVVNRNATSLVRPVPTSTVPAVEKLIPGNRVQIRSYLNLNDWAYDSLSNHLLNALVYPKKARENNTVGNVIVSYKVNSNHKINGIKLVKSIGGGCDEQMTAALNSFKGQINISPGEYLISGSFNIAGKDGFHSAGLVDQKIEEKVNYAGVVLIVGLNDYSTPSRK
ncbi:beta-lactamase regulating signal transducer with metallopeptidase domain/outer membrane biosynthesis protein TonB [Mucilaginibacter sp. UYNi724]